MKEVSIRAVIFGATGMVGTGVLMECLKHPRVEKVTVVTRKSTGFHHEKLKEIIHLAFLDYSKIEQELEGHNACFYCLGVSQTQVKGVEKYREITLDYTLAAAQALVNTNDDLTFCFLSGAGTDPTMKSRFMWARVKGEAENKLREFPFKAQYNFRPGYIHPIGDIKHSLAFARVISPLFPVLNKIFPALVTTTQEFGLAMINTLLVKPEKNVFENRDIRKLASAGLR